MKPGIGLPAPATILCGSGIYALSSAGNPPDRIRRRTSRHNGQKVSERRSRQDLVAHVRHRIREGPGLPALSVSSDFLDTAYPRTTATGSYTAGTTSGQHRRPERS